MVLAHLNWTYSLELPQNPPNFQGSELWQIQGSRIPWGSREPNFGYFGEETLKFPNFYHLNNNTDRCSCVKWGWSASLFKNKILVYQASPNFSCKKSLNRIHLFYSNRWRFTLHIPGLEKTRKRIAPVHWNLLRHPCTLSWQG